MRHENDPKAALRQVVKQHFAQLTLSERKERSQLITARLQEELHRLNVDTSHTLMLYAPLLDEVDVEEAGRWWIQRGCRLALPRILRLEKQLEVRLVSDWEAELMVGEYGIREPMTTCLLLDPGTIDVVIVPGRAFDEHCYRLGRGAGYYDRFLKLLRSEALKLGVAFDFQVFPQIPVKPNEAPVDAVITESRTLWRLR